MPCTVGVAREKRRPERTDVMNPLLVAASVVLLVLAGAAIGAFLRNRLPKHHLEDETKEMVKMGITFLSTLAALVLGLIISSAKASFDTVSQQVETSAAQILQLDNNLQQLGSSAGPARELLRSMVSSRLAEYWGSDRPANAQPAVGGARNDLHELQKTLHALSPTGAAEHSAWSKALQTTDSLAQISSVVVAHSGSSITMPLLVVLVFWLVIISVGINLFAPSNGTIRTVNVLCALSVAGAIFLILEMDHPYSGLLRVSDGPLRAVLVRLGN